DASGDAIYPDLAFSLPRTLIPAESGRDGTDVVIGVGVMDYYGGRHTGEPSDTVHRGYLTKLAAFVAWLLEHRYTVRLLIGDEQYDRLVRRELIRVLEQQHVTYREGQLIDDPIASPEDVLAQLATTDLVVAS